MVLRLYYYYSTMRPCQLIGSQWAISTSWKGQESIPTILTWKVVIYVSCLDLLFLLCLFVWWHTLKSLPPNRYSFNLLKSQRYSTSFPDTPHSLLKGQRLIINRLICPPHNNIICCRLSKFWSQFGVDGYVN